MGPHRQLQKFLPKKKPLSRTDSFKGRRGRQPISTFHPVRLEPSVSEAQQQVVLERANQRLNEKADKMISTIFERYPIGSLHDSKTWNPLTVKYVRRIVREIRVTFRLRAQLGKSRNLSNLLMKMLLAHTMVVPEKEWRELNSIFPHGKIPRDGLMITSGFRSILLVPESILNQDHTMLRHELDHLVDALYLESPSEVSAYHIGEFEKFMNMNTRGKRVDELKAARGYLLIAKRLRSNVPAFVQEFGSTPEHVLPYLEDRVKGFESALRASNTRLASDAVARSLRQRAKKRS